MVRSHTGEPFVCGFLVGDTLYSRRTPASMFAKLAEIVEQRSGKETACRLTEGINVEDGLDQLIDRWEEHLKAEGVEPPRIATVISDPKWARFGG